MLAKHKRGAIRDSQPGRVETLGAKYPDVKLERSLDALIEDRSIDGVVVATLRDEPK